MAKENTVFMKGIVAEKPTIKIKADTKEFVVARIKIMTVRRTWANEQMRLMGAPRMDVQYIITRNPRMIEKHIIPLQQGDVVSLKGSLSTRNTEKKFRCPHCSNLNVYDGAVMVYIDPIFIERDDSWSGTLEEKMQRLLSSAEVSNCALFFGTLCREPEYYCADNKEECDFQLATNRKRRIIEDGPDKTSDYPYVRAYGPMAKEYSEVLHMGSEIFINGAIQAREVTMLKTCHDCHKDFKAEGATMEIVPYSIEYIRNCNIPQKEEEKDQIFDGYEDIGNYEYQDEQSNEEENANLNQGIWNSHNEESYDDNENEYEDEIDESFFML